MSAKTVVVKIGDTMTKKLMGVATMTTSAAAWSALHGMYPP
jgi:hypothetical protein